MKRILQTCAALAALIPSVLLAQIRSPLVKVDDDALAILTPIDKAISALASNFPYLASWNIPKTNVYWATDGRQILATHIQYAHNLFRVGPHADDIQHGTNSCLISVGAPKRLSWSGLGVKTTIAGHVGDRDILVSCQTWNPENPTFEALIRRTVEMIVADLRQSRETNTPNQASDATSEPAPGAGSSSHQR